MNRRDLMILGGMFLFLLIFYVLQLTIFKPSEYSYRSVLLSYDTKEVDLIKFSYQEDWFEFVKSREGWEVSNSNVIRSNPKVDLDSLVGLMSTVSTQELVSRNPEDWSKYQTGDPTGRKFTFYSAGDTIGQIILGKMDYDEKIEQTISYARLDIESETYSLKGDYSIAYSLEIMIPGATLAPGVGINNINRLALISGDLEETISKSKSSWTSGKRLVNKQKLEYYLYNLSTLEGERLPEDFDEETGFGIIQSLIINDSISYDAFLHENGFVIKSSQNNYYYKSDSTGIYKTIFTDFEDLLILN